ncbi:hypothetical protein MMC10_000382 [Thelotrema lepadinum]|nr:hypothetical protein [Thelotrema lepadinum]
MNASISPSNLQIGSAGQDGTSGFVQNGQIDWMAFANTTWSSSTAILQRFASAGVQPVTFGAGIALASQFKLSRLSNQRMYDALNNIAGFWGYEKLLWFALGIRSFVRVMSDTQLGVNCLALCSTLAEVHGEEVSAWILEELWKAFDYPSQFLPSHSQFVTLIKACTGILTKTAFSSVVDSTLSHPIKERELLPVVSDPAEIAKALYGVFQISIGKFSRINFKGGLSCAFLASLAEWLFGFTIYVEDHLGRVIHQSTSFEAAQVHVAYSSERELSPVQISGTKYALDEFEILFNQNKSIDQTLLPRKAPWDGCLNQAFGLSSSYFDKRLILEEIGKFFGGAARIYKVLAEGETNIAKFS